ncbi:MAG TPA: thermonuclease family protein, partial [Spirochaetia bacterium]|nr:thermonuclease family protein [Spirochaetia bacterium]
CEIVRRKPGGVCLDQERSKLPYIFRDPVVFDSKADPKETSYESKIDGKARPREDYLNVREVVSPELVRLSNGLLVRLIGIRENPGTRAEAVAFLQEKTRGRKVFLRLDERRYDGHGNLLCYVFLKNRTHLNAHLVKKGLVDVDTAGSFKHRSRFLRFQGA